jgi:two-component system LytT family response regulator
MAAIERKLDPARFVRVHRSTIVRIDRIRELEPLFQGDYLIVLQDGSRLTSSRGYRGSVQRILEGASASS